MTTSITLIVLLAIIELAVSSPLIVLTTITMCIVLLLAQRWNKP